MEYPIIVDKFETVRFMESLSNFNIG